MKETSDFSLRGKPQVQRLFSPYGNQAAGWTTEESWFISQQEEGSFLTSNSEGAKQLWDQISLLFNGYRRQTPRGTWANHSNYKWEKSILETLIFF
jgi:hypothetical protein